MSVPLPKWAEGLGKPVQTSVPLPKWAEGLGTPVSELVTRELGKEIDLDSLDEEEIEDIQEYYEGSPKDIQWDFKHFKPSEFASKGNGQVKVSGRMVAALDSVREQLGLPIKITSGHRDEKHNKKVGGAKNSRHVEGDAVDINLADYDDQTRSILMRLLRKAGFTSFGSYSKSPNMLHADMRPSFAKWHYGRGGHPKWYQDGMQEGPMSLSELDPVDLKKV